MATANRLFDQVARQAARHPSSRHIKLNGLPPTAVPSDIRRLCANSRVEGVVNVAIDYNRFKPSGNGYIILRSPEFMERNLRLLQNTTVGGFRISALPSNDPDSQSRLSQRTRGAKGKAEAAHRGLLTGDGPGGGVTGGGKHVILSGLPGKMNADSVRVWLKNYKFANDGSGDVVKLDLPANHMSLMSKHFVRLANASEAHRLARTLHMTFFQQDVWDTKYLIKARVVH